MAYLPGEKRSDPLPQAPLPNASIFPQRFEILFEMEPVKADPSSPFSQTDGASVDSNEIESPGKAPN